MLSATFTANIAGFTTATPVLQDSDQIWLEPSRDHFVYILLISDDREGQCQSRLDNRLYFINAKLRVMEQGNIVDKKQLVVDGFPPRRVL